MRSYPVLQQPLLCADWQAGFCGKHGEYSLLGNGGGSLFMFRLCGDSLCCFLVVP